jgi:plasmid stabilization system protein ParE
VLKWSFAGQKKLPDDLEYITHYLFENAPGRTADLVREIYNAPSGLLKFPYRGRPAREVIHIGASYTVRRNGIKDSWLWPMIKIAPATLWHTNCSPSATAAK